MADPTAALVPDTRDLISFLDFQRPSLPLGDYLLQVHHEVGPDQQAASTFTAKLSFSVVGERVAFGQGVVEAAYPPDGADGDFQDELPHVVLHRSTLPWERTAGGGSPWLTILLFEQSEAPTARTCQLREVKGALRITPESAQSDDDPVCVIDVPAARLRALLPTHQELALLAHVRSVEHASGARAPEEQATILGSRVILADRTWVAHLVSVEGRYPGLLAAGEDVRTLISLHQWRFRSTATGPDFAGTLRRLDVQDGSAFGRVLAAARVPPAARPMVDSGHTLLPHALRSGDPTVSWYRGPLVARALPAAPPAPVRSADSLLRYDVATGCLDASFAAAWQLGRLLALEDGQYGLELLYWKQAVRQALARRDDVALAAHQPHPGASDTPAAPELVRDWLSRLARLERVPFTYLVPDERLLPVESVRFFSVDPNWVACLLDGALSLGRVLRKDVLRDEENFHREGLAPTRLSGVLLRSAVVRGYPGMEVDAYHLDRAPLDSTEQTHAAMPTARVAALRCVRRQRLGPDVLLCLFDGGDDDRSVDVIDVHLHPQHMHFGLQRVDGRAVKIVRSPRDGSRPPAPPVTPAFRPGGARVLDVQYLYDALRARYEQSAWEAFTPGDFAFQLLDPPPLVRFMRPDSRECEVIEGIGPIHAAALAEHGLHRVNQLRGLLRVAEPSWPVVRGVSPAQLRGWCYQADLMRVHGLDKDAAELLQAAGVNGLAQLARETSAALWRRLETANAQHTRARSVPHAATLTQWIREAQAMLVTEGP